MPYAISKIFSDGKVWAKIFVLNMIIYTFFQETVFDINIFLKIFIGLAVYYICVFRLHLIRSDVLSILPNIKIFSFFDVLKR
jgi:hypothetical protein